MVPYRKKSYHSIELPIALAISALVLVFLSTISSTDEESLELGIIINHSYLKRFLCFSFYFTYLDSTQLFSELFLLF